MDKDEHNEGYYIKHESKVMYSAKGSMRKLDIP